jgi:hypothetical protein
VDHKSQISVSLKRSWIRIRIRIKVESWIRIRIKVESWIRIRIKVESWILIRIKVESWIRTWLRIKVMRICNPCEVQMQNGKAKKEIKTISDSVVIDDLHAETGTLSGSEQLLAESCLICHS